MSLGGEKSFKMRMRDMENAFKYRRIPYPKRSVELIAILAISCTFFLFMHTNKLNSRLKEMEIKLQPSEFSALGLTGNQISPRESSRRDNINTLHGTYQYLKSTGQLNALTPRMLNNTEKAEIDILFFNRLEKVGSQSMSTLLRVLSRVNHFVYNIRVRTVGNMLDTIEEQRELADEIFDYGVPSAYTMHRNFINFTQLDMPKPIYINLVRHPIEKVKSAYYYMRHPFIYNNGLLRNPKKKTQSFAYFDTSFNDCVRDGKIPDCIFDPHIEFNGDWRRFSMHFCGNNPVCKQFNSQTATQIAKRNIESEFAVVGSWEDTNITLTVLEHYVPRFFRGATKVFYSDPKRFHKNATPHKNELDPDIEEHLKVQFSFEIELYNFCKQRLYKQYIAIKKDEVMRHFN
ncbi:heparan sulfate 2-O-sulfotransferase pipe-like isoform X2 [Bactrocera neohumeralis]|uniref:heparan sulfate 2-O-sulfotransferase pipe-like isoform X2 n=1 Tax=Bactrocera neohumeralis TaxID=98809 RepID=UPI00216576B0|nr:heparan sulfate 2-O-sulfotransferase pipe-like isoform X2 [Bactrocera neohumeralis]